MRQPVPFGKYLLLDRISVGGMAEVFKAKSYGVEGFEKIIAIKRILPTMGEDRDFIKMFIDEAKIAGQLAHANICQIFELGRIDGSHFIAMEYIWGKDLLQIQNRLRKLKQPMPIPMACFIIAKTLEGLDYAHRKRDPLGRPLEIVHRDCSPQNVLVSYEGEVKVIDFGIAKATSRNSRTMAGVLKGKFGYMSPEQVRGLPLDRRSDLFALGTMLFECLTSERLFQGETDFSTLEKVRNVDIQPPRAVNPNIPEHIERVILKALAKDVDDRYQWCSEMLADLQQFLMSQDVVFTAKSLSSWLKEMFQPEIERERAQLEQYKRVGRDGLIGGMPAAEAQKTMDVVEHLGEAGQAEASDATQLGGPSFEGEDSGVGAVAPPPEPVIPAAGRPATPPVGRPVQQPPPPAPTPPAPTPPPAAQQSRRAASEDGDGDFGEEAPTEIFGDLDSPPVPTAPAPTPAAGRPPTTNKGPAQPQPRSTAAGPAALNRDLVPPSPPRAPAQPTGPMPPPVTPPQPMHAQAAPPLAPPAQAQMQQQQQPQMPPPQQQQQQQQQAYDPNGHNGNNNGYGQPPPYGYGQPPQQGYDPNGNTPAPQFGQYPSQPQMQPPMGMAQNGSSMPGLAAPGQGPSKTVLGQAPPNLGNYGQPSSPYASQMPPQQNPYGYPQMPPNNSGQMPGQNPYDQYPQAGQLQGYGQAPQQMGYGSQPQAVAAAPAVTDSRANKKKSTLVRDILIGVAIAAIALGGILAVKMFVLDSGDDGGDGSGAAALATIRLSLPAGVSADLYVDGKKIAVVGDKQEVPLTAGHRKIKLQSLTGRCETEVELTAGQTTPLNCQLAGGGSAATPTPGSAAIGITPPTGSGGGGGGTGSGGMAMVGSGNGAGSASAVKTPGTGSGAPSGKLPETLKTPGTGSATRPEPPRNPGNGSATHTTPKNPLPPEVPAGDTGFLTLTSKPPAKIFVDGTATGLTTPVGGNKLKLAAGKHKITFEVGGDKYTYPVTIRPGETASLNKDLQ